MAITAALLLYGLLLALSLSLSLFFSIPSNTLFTHSLLTHPHRHSRVHSYTVLSELFTFTFSRNRLSSCKLAPYTMAHDKLSSAYQIVEFVLGFNIECLSHYPDSNAGNISNKDASPCSQTHNHPSQSPAEAYQRTLASHRSVRAPSIPSLRPKPAGTMLFVFGNVATTKSHSTSTSLVFPVSSGCSGSKWRVEL